MQRVSAWLAVSFGVFLAIAEAVRNWGDWQWWPFWLVDYIAAALLITGGVLTLRRRPRGAVWLAGSWGFATAMVYMSFWSHISQIDQPAEGNIPQVPLTTIIGILWLLTIVGFLLALAPPARGTASADP